MINRKRFLAYLGACGASGILGCKPGKGESVAGREQTVWVPYPGKPWAQATRIVGHRSQPDLETFERQRAENRPRLPLYNDFCLVQDGIGRWHCIGILFEGASSADYRQDRLFHCVAHSIDGPYQQLDRLDLGFGSQAGVWAPFVLRAPTRSVMFYATNENGARSIREAQASDATLESWHRLPGRQEVIVAEPAARDPQVIFNEKLNRYLLYYVATVSTEGQQSNVVRLRTSTDLSTWSGPRTVLGTPPGYVAAESVFVLEKSGYFYMWVSGVDYSRMSLYISETPFDFGDAQTNRIEEQPGHAAEIAWSEGRYWMACAAISSIPGLPPIPQMPAAWHDLAGVYIQPLQWRAATGTDLAKITRHTSD